MFLSLEISNTMHEGIITEGSDKKNVCNFVS